MSDQPWQNVSPQAMQALYAQSAMGPNWSSKGFTPWDGGDQKSALNFNQDFLSWLMNPQIGIMAGEGAYNADAMQLAMQQYQAGRTEGTDFLNAVAAQSPNSPQGMIAYLIGQNRTPQQAIAEAKAAIEKKGGTWPTIITDKGMKVDDPSIARDAQSWWENYLKDKPGTGTNNPFTAAGFSDPSARFTPDMFAKQVDQGGKMVPEYDVFGQRADKSAAEVKKTQAALDAYYKSVMNDRLDPNRLRKSFNGSADRLPSPALKESWENDPSIKSTIMFQKALAGAPAGAYWSDVPKPTWPSPMTPDVMGNGKSAAPAAGFNPVLQDALSANLQHGKDANSAFLSGAFANAKANQNAAVYGSPYQMEMAQRMALGRRLGIAQ